MLAAVKVRHTTAINAQRRRESQAMDFSGKSRRKAAARRWYQAWWLPASIVASGGCLIVAVHADWLKLSARPATDFLALLSVTETLLAIPSSRCAAQEAACYDLPIQ
jgi:hypothetical protein